MFSIKYLKKRHFIHSLILSRGQTTAQVHDQTRLVHMKLFVHLGPADITEQLTSVQNSVMVPYSMLIWLKKSTAEKINR